MAILFTIKSRIGGSDGRQTVNIIFQIKTVTIDVLQAKPLIFEQVLKKGQIRSKWAKTTKIVSSSPSVHLFVIYKCKTLVNIYLPKKVQVPQDFTTNFHIYLTKKQIILIFTVLVGLLVGLSIPLQGCAAGK